MRPEQLRADPGPTTPDLSAMENVQITRFILSNSSTYPPVNARQRKVNFAGYPNARSVGGIFEAKSVPISAVFDNLVKKPNAEIFRPKNLSWPAFALETNGGGNEFRA